MEDRLPYTLDIDSLTVREEIATNLELVNIEDALGPGSMANKKQLS